MKRKNCLLALGMVFVMGITGCQKSPDSSIVVNKDMDNLIEEAQNGEGSANMEDIGNYDTYQTTLEDESLGVTVDVDAKVDIPKTSQMSVIRVKQKTISQEFLDTVKEELVQDETLYDGAVLSVRTRSDLEAEIASLQAELKALDKNDENYALLKEEYQSEIDQLQEAYENAPEAPAWEDNESDGLLHSTAEMAERDVSQDFYAWEYSLNQNGEVYYGVNDGKDGKYVSLFVQNNEDLGNCLRYRSSRNGYVFTASAVTGGSVLDNPYASMIWKAGEEAPDDLFEQMMGEEVSFVEYENEKTTISQEEAQALAEEFLEKAGLTEYEFYEGGLYCEVQDIRSGENAESYGYLTCYILRYARNIDGAFVTMGGASKHTEGWDGDDYVKKDWPEESVEFRISDDGIIGFDYNVPLEMVETVVEGSNMKSFDEIKSIFEKMVIVTNASEYGKVSIQIDRVALGYARISEADSYDTGLLVPVWDFQGIKTDEDMEMTYRTSVLTVNAIDGSVIDRTLGY